MDMIGQVRRMKLRKQLSNSEIAKRTRLSRNTVKNWLKAPGDHAPKYKRPSEFTKLSAFEATLVQALKADSHRLKHAQRSARAMLDRLKHHRHIVETRLEPYRFRHSFNEAWVRIKAWEQIRKMDKKELQDDN